MSYGILLCIALLLNINNKKMLLLILAIGVGIFIPIPDENFYFVCIMVEIFVALIAYRTNLCISYIIIRLSILLIVFHILGFLLDGYPVSSPYHILVKISEHAEIIVCILFSNTFIKKGI
jgi:hypothetical protein